MLYSASDIFILPIHNNLMPLHSGTLPLPLYYGSLPLPLTGQDFPATSFPRSLRVFVVVGARAVNQGWLLYRPPPTFFFIPLPHKNTHYCTVLDWCIDIEHAPLTSGVSMSTPVYIWRLRLTIPPQVLAKPMLQHSCLYSLLTPSVRSLCELPAISFPTLSLWHCKLKYCILHRFIFRRDVTDQDTKTRPSPDL